MLTPHTTDVLEAWEDDGVEVRSFRYAPEGWEVLGYSRSLSADETIRWRAGVVTPLYLMAARAAVRRLCREREIDLIHGHWVVPNGLVAAYAGLDVPTAVGLHGSDVFLAERRGVRSLVGRALARTTLLTGCSPELVDRVCALGFDPGRSRVIPYGVDTAVFSPDREKRSLWRDKLGIPDEAVMAVSVGRMVTKKGDHVLIEVLPGLLEAHPELHVVLAGGGDLLDSLRDATRPWSDRVHLPGVVLRDTLPDLYRAADLFVLPAVHDPKGNVDGLPNVILEAMASGLPVVASGISGIPLAIGDGSEGRLVPEQDPEQLGQALAELVGDPEKCRRMGASARAKAERELTWRTIAGRYRQAYVDALEGFPDRVAGAGEKEANR